MPALILSLLMLGCAPVLVTWTRHLGRARRAAETVLIGLVAAIVVLHLLPESIHVLGSSATVLALLGLFAPSGLERLLAPIAAKVHMLTQLLAVSGLFLHGMLDGAALVDAPLLESETAGWNLRQIAVIIHRLPAAMFLWAVFTRRGGYLQATAVLVLLGLGTLAGYAIGLHNIRELSDVRIFFAFQAVVAGSLLHIAFDRHGDLHPHAGHNHF